MNRNNKLTIPVVTNAIRIPVSSEQQLRLRRIDDECYTAVISLALRELAKQRRDVPIKRAYTAIYALKQYYSLSVIDPNHLHAIADALDPFCTRTSWIPCATRSCVKALVGSCIMILSIIRTNQRSLPLLKCTVTPATFCPSFMARKIWTRSSILGSLQRQAWSAHMTLLPSMRARRSLDFHSRLMRICKSCARDTGMLHCASEC